jgi:hypothetical protein
VYYQSCPGEECYPIPVFSMVNVIIVFCNLKVSGYIAITDVGSHGIILVCEECGEIVCDGNSLYCYLRHHYITHGQAERIWVCKNCLEYRKKGLAFVALWDSVQAPKYYSIFN